MNAGYICATNVYCNYNQDIRTTGSSGHQELHWDINCKLLLIV